MRHNTTNYQQEPNGGNHYAVGINMNDELLLQVQDNGEQVRIILTPDEAIHLRSLIDDALSRVGCDPYKHVREVVYHLFDRYMKMFEQSIMYKSISALKDTEEGAALGLASCINHLAVDRIPIDKLNRWLGFVQAIAIKNKLTTINEERDYSRPLFHTAYANDRLPIPKTYEV